MSRASLACKFDEFYYTVEMNRTKGSITPLMLGQTLVEWITEQRQAQLYTVLRTLQTFDDGQLDGIKAARANLLMTWSQLRLRCPISKLLRIGATAWLSRP